MGKELFGQTLKDKLGISDRIASGVPGQEGCDNILRGDLFGSIMQYGKGVSLTQGSNSIVFAKALDNDQFALFVRTYNGVAYEEVSRDQSGFVIEVLANTTIDYLAILF